MADAEDLYKIVGGRRPPPGATRVYCATPKGHDERRMFHPDHECPRLSTAWRVTVHPLVDVVNSTRWNGCPYCAAGVDVLRAVVRDHDEHGEPIALQAALP